MNHRTAVFTLVMGKRHIDDIGFPEIATTDTVARKACLAESGVRGLCGKDAAAVAALPSA